MARKPISKDLNHMMRKVNDSRAKEEGFIEMNDRPVGKAVHTNVKQVKRAECTRLVFICSILLPPPPTTHTVCT